MAPNLVAYDPAVLAPFVPHPPVLRGVVVALLPSPPLGRFEVLACFNGMDELNLY